MLKDFLKKRVKEKSKIDNLNVDFKDKVEIEKTEMKNDRFKR